MKETRTKEREREGKTKGRRDGKGTSEGGKERKGEEGKKKDDGDGKGGEERTDLEDLMNGWRKIISQEAFIFKVAKDFIFVYQHFVFKEGRTGVSVVPLGVVLVSFQFCFFIFCFLVFLIGSVTSMRGISVWPTRKSSSKFSHTCPTKMILFHSNPPPAQCSPI